MAKKKVTKESGAEKTKKKTEVKAPEAESSKASHLTDQMFVQVEYGFTQGEKEESVAFMGNVSLESLADTLRSIRDEGIVHTIAIVIKPSLLIANEEFQGKENVMAKTDPHILPKIKV